MLLLTFIRSTVVVGAAATFAVERSEAGNVEEDNKGVVVVLEGGGGEEEGQRGVVGRPIGD